MRDFDYTRASSIDEAAAAAMQAETALLAGGTTLIDLAKCGVATPARLVDINRLPGLDGIAVSDSRLSIGALARMSDVAANEDIRRLCPAITEALLLAASAQLRNMASIGGNLLQRTRCSYFRDPQTFPACNKRAPGSGCSAIGGVTRNHAVLGTSDHCIAAYPGDLAVALAAFDATIVTSTRRIPIDDFFVTPGEHPERETIIAAAEIITSVEIEAGPVTRRSTYLKVRDRQSYEFAAASAAVGLDLDADGRTVRDIRVAVGGVATKPWRAHGVETAIKGKPLTEETVRAAARFVMEGAVAHGDNSYKIDLAPRVVARAILSLGGLA